MDDVEDPLQIISLQQLLFQKQEATQTHADDDTYK